MIGDKIDCLKKIGSVQLSDATSYCQSLNASQILPRNRQESDDLIPALISLDLASEDGKTLVSIDISKTKEEWRDSTGQPISYFNWLPNEPDNLGGSQNYAGFQIGGFNQTAKWNDYNGTDKLNVVCTKTASHGKNSSTRYTNYKIRDPIDKHNIFSDFR